MKRYSGHKEEWGSFVDVKVNAAKVLEEQLIKAKKGDVYISSVCDAYQPIEKKYELTRKLLKLLLRRQFPVVIQTKSNLVLRDIDVIKQFDDAEVGITITTLDDNFAKKLEPKASLPSARIKALEKLNKAGIKTYVFVGPIMPFITDYRGIIEQTGFVDKYFFDKLNYFKSKWQKLEKAIPSNLIPEYEKIFLGKSDYYAKVKREIRGLLKEKEVTWCY